MFYSVRVTAPEAVMKLNAALKDVSEWVNEADLVLNEHKCLAMIVSSQYSRSQSTHDTSAVQLGNHTLKQEVYTKYLRVIVDKHLQWDQQCKAVKKKITTGICYINRAKAGLPNEERRSLYRAFIEPYLDYRAPV